MAFKIVDDSRHEVGLGELPGVVHDHEFFLVEERFEIQAVSVVVLLEGGTIPDARGEIANIFGDCLHDLMRFRN